MYYMLDEGEYDKLTRSRAEMDAESSFVIADLCRQVCDLESKLSEINPEIQDIIFALSKGFDARISASVYKADVVKPGCIRGAGPSETRYCDKCSINDICTWNHKHWSK